MFHLRPWRFPGIKKIFWDDFQLKNGTEFFVVAFWWTDFTALVKLDFKKMIIERGATAVRTESLFLVESSSFAECPTFSIHLLKVYLDSSLEHVVQSVYFEKMARIDFSVG